MGLSAQHHRRHAGWFKSSYSSSTGSCVEVRFDARQVAVRDSKQAYDAAPGTATEPMLTVAPRQWAAFLADVRR
ncbi:MAG: DUF397 domain-containing protein [Nocardioidaceae bacterium]